MSATRRRKPLGRRWANASGTGVVASTLLLSGLVNISPAAAALATVNLGTAATFGVLGATTVTNTGLSVITKSNVGPYVADSRYQGSTTSEKIIPLPAGDEVASTYGGTELARAS